MTPPDQEELARLAREAVPEVLQAAVARAREDAVARLAALLSDEIVAQALARHAGPPAEPEVRMQHNRAAGQSLYAYAIARADLRLPEDIRALTDGGSVRLVVDGDVALLVSPLDPEQLKVDEEDLSENGRLAVLARGHDGVIRAAASAGPVLPLRFGTAVPDDDAARRLLRVHARAARAQLDRIGDTREWGVRLVRSVAEPVPAGPSHREDISGSEYLSRRREALAARDHADQDVTRAAERLHDVLADHVTESVRRGGNPGSSLLLDLACLVSPERETAFADAVAQLREELRGQGLDVELSGPWPPYSFASLDAAQGVSDGA